MQVAERGTTLRASSFDELRNTSLFSSLRKWEAQFEQASRTTSHTDGTQSALPSLARQKASIVLEAKLAREAHTSPSKIAPEKNAMAVMLH